jgi:hypothetical protein
LAFLVEPFHLLLNIRLFLLLTLQLFDSALGFKVPLVVSFQLLLELVEFLLQAKSFLLQVLDSLLGL